MFVSNAVAIAEADEITAAIDGGTGPGVARLYDENGDGVPADADAALGTNVILLAEMTLSDPSFASAVDDDPGARIDLDVTPIPEDTSANASASATPTLFLRIDDSAGTTCVQLDASEFTINSPNVSAGSSVQITAGSITVSESGP